MKATRQTQPYRQTGSRGASQVLSTMTAGRSAGRTENALMAVVRKRKGMPTQTLSVPRVSPLKPR